MLISVFFLFYLQHYSCIQVLHSAPFVLWCCIIQLPCFSSWCSYSFLSEDLQRLTSLYDEQLEKNLFVTFFYLYNLLFIKGICKFKQPWSHCAPPLLSFFLSKCINIKKLMEKTGDSNNNDKILWGRKENIIKKTLTNGSPQLLGVMFWYTQ